MARSHWDVFKSQDTKWLPLSRNQRQRLLSRHDGLFLLGEQGHVHIEVESTGVVAGSLRVGELNQN